MVIQWSLYALMKLTPFSLLASIFLTVWRVLPLSTDPDVTLIMGTWTLFAVGSVCYLHRHYRTFTAGLVLAAVNATQPPKPSDEGHLRLVPQENLGAAAERLG